MPRNSLGLLPVQRFNARIIARDTRLSVNALVYRFTVADPVAYSGPWLADFPLKASDMGNSPSPTHEHNHSLPNILFGQRIADARVASN